MNIEFELLIIVNNKIKMDKTQIISYEPSIRNNETP